MSTDLRDRLQQAYPTAPSEHPAPSRLWAQGQLRRRRRTATSAAASLVLVVAIVAAGMRMIEPTVLPYVGEDPSEPADPLDHVEIEPLRPEVIQGILAADSPPVDPGPDEGGLTMQERILADGLVTPDEYRRAMQSTVTCVEQAGFDAAVTTDSLFEPSIPPGLVLGHTITIPTNGPDPGELLEQCRAQWSWQVEQIWLAQILPPPAEREQAWQRFWDCVRDQGVHLSDPPNAEQRTEAMSYLDQCLP